MAQIVVIILVKVEYRRGKQIIQIQSPMYLKERRIDIITLQFHREAARIARSLDLCINHTHCSLNPPTNVTRGLRTYYSWMCSTKYSLTSQVGAKVLLYIVSVSWKKSGGRITLTEDHGGATTTVLHQSLLEVRPRHVSHALPDPNAPNQLWASLIKWTIGTLTSPKITPIDDIHDQLQPRPEWEISDSETSAVRNSATGALVSRLNGTLSRAPPPRLPPLRSSLWFTFYHLPSS